VPFLDIMVNPPAAGVIPIPVFARDIGITPHPPMNYKTPRIDAANTPESPFISNPGANFYDVSAENPQFGLVAVIAGVFAALLAVTGCTSPQKPVVVQVNDHPALVGRFRSPERQRDVWIAPQAVDNGTLQHDQVVTFVEKPSAWQLPSTIEPNTVSQPALSLQEGEYDGEALRREREMLTDTQEQIRKLNENMEKVRVDSQKAIAVKDAQLQELSKKLQGTEKQFQDASQKLNDIAEAERQKQEEAAKKPKWKFWK
jgi:hypothetical protein